MTHAGPQDLKAKTTRGVAWVASSTLTMAVARIALFAGLARLLMPADFGLFAASTSILGILEVGTLLGVCPALIQRKELTSRHTSTAFVLACGFGAAAAAALWFSAGAIAGLMKIAALGPVLRVVAPIFVIRGFSMWGYGLAARAMRFSLTTLAELSAFFVYALVTVLLAMAGFGYWALIIGYCLQTALYAAIVVLPFSAQLAVRVYRQELGELVRFCFGINIANIASYLAGQGDNYVVGRMLGAESLGFYSRAYNLMQTFVTSVINTLDNVFFPSLAKMQNDRAGLARTLRLSTALVWLGYLPLTALVLVCAPDIVAVLFGPRWTPMVATFRILSFGLTFRAGYKMAGTILTVQAHTSALAATQSAYAILVIAGAAVGSRFGTEGAAAGVLCALGVNYLLINLLGFRSVRQPVSALRRDLLAAVVLAAAVYAAAAALGQLSQQLGLWPVARLASAGLGALVAYLLFFTLVAPTLVSREAMDFLRSIRQSLRSRWSRGGLHLRRSRPEPSNVGETAPPERPALLGPRAPAASAHSLAD